MAFSQHAVHHVFVQHDDARFFGFFSQDGLRDGLGGIVAADAAAEGQDFVKGWRGRLGRLDAGEDDKCCKGKKEDSFLSFSPV